MFEFYNAHPKGLRVGDCVKRAITKATGIDYEEVSRELNRFKKISGKDKFNQRDNCNAYVEEVLKGRKMSFPAERGKDRMNGHTFCNKYQSGAYILNMARHWTCCVDGVIYDTWDCRDKCVYTAYEIDLSKVGRKVKDYIKELSKQKETNDKYKMELKELRKTYNAKIKKLQKELEEKENKLKVKYNQD